MIKLKPCPWCGGPVYAYPNSDTFIRMNHKDDCFWSLMHDLPDAPGNAQKLIEAWDRRVENAAD